MKPMKSKYTKHRASKYVFPTTTTPNSGITYGEKPARLAVEKRIGRRLSDDMVTRHTSTQWVFCEPKAVPA